MRTLRELVGGGNMINLHKTTCNYKLQKSMELSTIKKLEVIDLRHMKVCKTR